MLLPLDSARLKFWQGVLVAKAYAPSLAFGTGLAGIVVTGFLLVKKSLEFAPAVNAYQEDILDLEDGQSEYGKQLTKAFVIEIAKHYGPTVGLGVVSLALLMLSHKMMLDRNAALMAAYKSLDLAYKKYRKDVELNEPKLADAVQYPQKELRAASLPEDVPSPYAVLFGPESSMWRRDNTLNEFLLTAQERYANDLLKIRGHLFLNEVYDMLSLPRTKEGAIVGWVLGAGDDYVSFSIYNPYNCGVSSEIKKDLPAILLDFNVSGIMYDKV